MKRKIMRNPLLLISFFIILQSYGQDSIQNKISLGVYYSPNISYRTLRESPITDIRNEQEVIKFGQSYGLIFQYKAFKYFGFESGLQYNNRGYQTDWTDSFYIDESGFDFSDRHKIIDKFQYLGIPVKVYYQKNSNKVSFFSSVGAIGNIFLSNKTIIKNDYKGQIEESVNDNSDNCKNFVLTLAADVGVERNLSDKYKILITSTFQHDITTINESSSLKEYLWDLGLKIGLIYNL